MYKDLLTHITCTKTFTSIHITRTNRFTNIHITGTKTLSYS